MKLKRLRKALRLELDNLSDEVGLYAERTHQQLGDHIIETEAKLTDIANDIDLMRQHANERERATSLRDERLLDLVKHYELQRAMAAKSARSEFEAITHRFNSLEARLLEGLRAITVEVKALRNESERARLGPPMNAGDGITQPSAQDFWQKLILIEKLINTSAGYEREQATSLIGTANAINTNVATVMDQLTDLRGMVATRGELKALREAINPPEVNLGDLKVMTPLQFHYEWELAAEHLIDWLQKAGPILVMPDALKEAKPAPEDEPPF